MIYDGLTKREIAERTQEFKANIKPGSIQPKTNRGVRLGMSRPQVLRILGKPTKEIWSKKFKAQELIYRRQPKLDKEGMGVAYSNYYLFRNGRLFYVELSQSAIGGG